MPTAPSADPRPPPGSPDRIAFLARRVAEQLARPKKSRGSLFGPADRSGDPVPSAQPLRPLKSRNGRVVGCLLDALPPPRPRSVRERQLDGNPKHMRREALRKRALRAHAPLSWQVTVPGSAAFQVEARGKREAAAVAKAVLRIPRRKRLPPLTDIAFYTPPARAS